MDNISNSSNKKIKKTSKETNLLLKLSKNNFLTFEMPLTMGILSMLISGLFYLLIGVNEKKLVFYRNQGETAIIQSITETVDFYRTWTILIFILGLIFLSIVYIFRRIRE